MGFADAVGAPINAVGHMHRDGADLLVFSERSVDHPAGGMAVGTLGDVDNAARLPLFLGSTETTGQKNKKKSWEKTKQFHGLRGVLEKRSVNSLTNML